ncbi:MAG: tandem-95 repeat protein [Anaerolineae bacterium]|nr:tandem-95 repeat protein [Anaerolineae bacterium]
MNRPIAMSPRGRRLWRHISTLVLIVSTLGGLVVPWPFLPTRAQDAGSQARFDEGIDAAAWYQDHEIEHAWQPDYLEIATGDPTLQTTHGVYAWPFALDSIGWNIQSYQDYGGTPYFHHGLDMMKVYGTQVFNRSGGQVVNIENYQPGNDLYWEVAVLDPDGYLWQYHHIDEDTIPQPIKDKFAEYQADPVNGGFIPADTHIGNIVYWPVWSFGKQFNHIHLNILAAGGVYVNGFEFHVALPDTDGPEIQAVGLLQNGQIYPGDEIEGDYSLYVHARDLVLDDVYYLPPYEVTFSMDGGPVHTTWRFDTLPGGADQYAYLHDFYVVPPTCGDYGCREFYIDLGFIPGAQFEFPARGGEHVALVTVRDYAGNSASQPYTYTVLGPPNQAPTAHPQSVSTSEDTPLDLLLAGSDPEDDPLVYSVVLSPTQGTLTGTAPALTYVPAADYYGPDSLSFVVSDGYSTSAPAVVSIDVAAVNDAPVANAQSVFTVEDTALDLTLTASDVDGDALTYHLVLSPSHGTLTGTAPALTYVPAADYYGADSLAFFVDDGQVDSAQAVVTIDITSDNDAPVAEPLSITTWHDRPVPIVLSGSDVDGDPLTYVIVTQPEHGTLSGSAPSLIYTPAPGYAGLDAFTFVVDDGALRSAAAEVHFTIRFVVYVPVVVR